VAFTGENGPYRQEESALSDGNIAYRLAKTDSLARKLSESHRVGAQLVDGAGARRKANAGLEMKNQPRRGISSARTFKYLPSNSPQSCRREK
jgi:hypothetical protein